MQQVESGVEKLVEALCDRLAVLDPGAYDGHRAAALAEHLARTENICAAHEGPLRGAGGRVRRAPRAGIRRRSRLGGGDVRHHVEQQRAMRCRRSRASTSAPRHAMQWPPATCRWPRPARSFVPSAKHRGPSTSCWTSPKRQSLGAVREKARTRRFEAIDREELRAKQHAAREVRHWTDELGHGRRHVPPRAGRRHPVRQRGSNARPTAAGAGEARGPQRIAAGTRGRRVRRPARRRVEIGADGRSPRSTRWRCDGGATQTPAKQRASPPDQRRRGDRAVSRGGPSRLGASRRGVSRRRRRAGGAVRGRGADRGRRVREGGAPRREAGHPRRPLRADTSPRRCALPSASVPPPAFDGLRCTEDGCERRLGLEIDHLDPVAQRRSRPPSRTSIPSAGCTTTPRPAATAPPASSSRARGLRGADGEDETGADRARR